MQGKHTGAIRGLGIAAIALSVICLLGCLFSAIILAMTGSTFGGGVMESLSYELMYDLDYYYGPMLAEGMGSFVGWVIGLLALVLGWEVLTCVVTLIAGILGLRNAANVAKLGGVFGWSIAGAAAAFLGGRLITMALLIIMAVLAKKTQDAANVAYWQNVAAQQGQQYGHNVYAQPAPAQGYAAPAAAAAAAPGYAPAAGQPNAYQQTYAPQQPAQQVAYSAQPAQVAQQPNAQAAPAAQPAQVAQPVDAAPTAVVEAVATEPAAAAEPAAEPAITQEPLDEVGDDAKAYEPEAASATEPLNDKTEAESK